MGVDTVVVAMLVVDMLVVQCTAVDRIWEALIWDHHMLAERIWDPLTWVVLTIRVTVIMAAMAATVAMAVESELVWGATRVLVGSTDRTMATVMAVHA